MLINLINFNHQNYSI
jgi:solute carrier family 25 oxoglutarate transporter 11